MKKVFWIVIAMLIAAGGYAKNPGILFTMKAPGEDTIWFGVGNWGGAYYMVYGTPDESSQSLILKDGIYYTRYDHDATYKNLGETIDFTSAEHDFSGEAMQALYSMLMGEIPYNWNKMKKVKDKTTYNGHKVTQYKYKLQAGQTVILYFTKEAKNLAFVKNWNKMPKNYFRDFGSAMLVTHPKYGLLLGLRYSDGSEVSAEIFEDVDEQNVTLDGYAEIQ